MQQVRQQTVLHVRVHGDIDAAGKLLEGHALVEKVETKGDLLILTLIDNTSDYSELPSLLIQNGFKLKLFKEDELNLETAFMALTKGITS